MSDLRDLSIKVQNYKSFGEEAAGFERILPVNVIIGRNNTGKSALLDVLECVFSRKKLPSEYGHAGKKPEINLSLPIPKKVLSGLSGIGQHEVRVLQSNRVCWLHGDLAKDVRLKSGGTRELNQIAQQVLPLLGNPLSGKHLIRLLADRDIRPEEESDRLDVHSDGGGTTSALQLIGHRLDHPTEILERQMLQDLNRIFNPDSIFERIEVKQLKQKEEARKWEVFLHEKGRRIALSASGSGLKTVLLVLTMFHVVPVSKKHGKDSESLQDFIFAFEELENNLHPAVQRRLLLYLKEKALQTGCTIFLTTHSNVAIDLFAGDDQAQIVHVTHDGKAATVTRVTSHLEGGSVLDDLGVKASDLLQANGIIWVEGPSDRIYLKRWIDLVSNKKLTEGVHYQIVFYGGRLLPHLSAKVPDLSENVSPGEKDVADFIRLLRINRNAAILMDSDRKVATDKLNQTKTRIISEFQGMDAEAWVTGGRAIENYLSPDLLRRHFQNTSLAPSDPFEDFEVFYTKAQTRRKEFERYKVTFASEIAPKISLSDLEHLDLKGKVEDLCSRIRRWNHEPGEGPTC